ncbi:hypothetical protein ACFSTH_03305 [Paenibacillus yanchengensis]|uniref:Uncharacterized protein n=1 Tax=Paenibacillus yanchengensis TaxID=2035833 RepID=A0ABW4YG10_9BACL
MYTFKKADVTDGTEAIYDTIIDYSFITPMKVGNQDAFITTVGDFLNPIDPLNGAMYTKPTANDSWQFFKELVPIMTSLQSFTVEGEQLTTLDDYTRVILHFSSLPNEQASASSFPEYKLEYNHHTNGFFYLTWIQIGIVVIVLAVILYLWRKWKLFRKMT